MPCVHSSAPTCTFDRLQRQFSEDCGRFGSLFPTPQSAPQAHKSKIGDFPCDHTMHSWNGRGLIRTVDTAFEYRDFSVTTEIPSRLATNPVLHFGTSVLRPRVSLSLSCIGAYLHLYNQKAICFTVVVPGPGLIAGEPKQYRFDPAAIPRGANKRRKLVLRPDIAKYHRKPCAIAITPVFVQSGVSV